MVVCFIHLRFRHVLVGNVIYTSARGGKTRGLTAVDGRRDAAVGGRASDQDDDAEVLRLLATDPASGMEQLYDRYSPLVYGLARKILGDPQEAQDLTQEVFVSLLNRCAYDPARGSFASFLTAMARSRAIDQLRARSRSSRLLGIWGDETAPGAQPQPHEAVAEGECAHSVQAALAALPDTQRRVLELAYFKGLSQSEIARALDTPLGTVKTWARNGLYSLRDALRNFSG
jgi:RNA polymerase sigma-70 factor, ECF subfamily